MLRKVEKKLVTSSRPVLETIHSQKDSKIIAVGLKCGVEFAEHTAPGQAKLIMIKGEIDFNMKDESLRFETLDTYDIPLKVKHSVVAMEDAIFLLVLSDD